MTTETINHTNFKDSRGVSRSLKVKSSPYVDDYEPGGDSILTEP